MGLDFGGQRKRNEVKRFGGGFLCHERRPLVLGQGEEGKWSRRGSFGVFAIRCKGRLRMIEVSRHREVEIQRIKRYWEIAGKMRNEFNGSDGGALFGAHVQYVGTKLARLTWLRESFLTVMYYSSTNLKTHRNINF